MLRSSSFWPDWDSYVWLGVFHCIFSAKRQRGHILLFISPPKYQYQIVIYQILNIRRVLYWDNVTNIGSKVQTKASKSYIFPSPLQSRAGDLVTLGLNIYECVRTLCDVRMAYLGAYICVPSWRTYVWRTWKHIHAYLRDVRTCGVEGWNEKKYSYLQAESSDRWLLHRRRDTNYIPSTKYRMTRS